MDQDPMPEADTANPGEQTAQIAIYPEALSKLHLVAVSYSAVEREWFPTDEAYEAEREVEYRANDVVKELEKMGVPAKAYPGDQYFFTNLLVDKPELVLNLVDTLRGKDSLQTSVPAALELANFPYTGAGMKGMVIGNDRNLFKQLLKSNSIPTPPFQYIRDLETPLKEDLSLPLIVKLSESGGSVGIDNHAVKETLQDAQDKVREMIGTYNMPVVVERFIDGPEVTVCVFDDGITQHVFAAEKIFHLKPDGKHNFTSRESYDEKNPYSYKKLEGPLKDEIERLSRIAFNALYNKDYAKFDVRVDAKSRTPYFTDCNPNTAFGPDPGLPFTEVLNLYGIKFETVLCSLVSKYAQGLE